MNEYSDVMHIKNVMSVLSQEISKLQQTVVDKCLASHKLCVGLCCKILNTMKGQII